MTVLSLLSPAARRRFWLLLAAMTAGSLLEVGTIGAVSRFMAGPALPLGLAALGLLALSNLSSALVQWRWSRFCSDQEQELSARLLSAYLRMPYPWFLQQNTAILKQNVLSGAVVRGVLAPLTTCLSRGTIAVLLMAMLIWADPALAMVASAVISSAYLLLAWVIRRWLAHLGEATQVASDRAHQTAEEALDGAKVLRVLDRAEEFERRYRLQGGLLSRNRAALALASDLPRYLFETVAIGSLVLLALYLVKSGQSTARTMATLSLYALAGYRLIPALHVVFASFSVLRFSLPQLERYREALASAGPPPPPSSQRLPLEDSLTVRELHFAYEREKVLHGISLEVPRHTSLALVGPTGCGKTTLVDLIVGLLSPQEGQICVDGRPVTDTPAWQRSLGYVPQDAFLVDASVLENVALGIAPERIDRAAVERAARLASLHDFVVGLPEGYDTVVGDRGVRLSGGQRQRLAIARALYHDPEVLVMDEATSALDGVTERAVQEAIGSLAGRKTVIVVAHRLSTVESCDQIVLLERGRVVARGTYAELIADSPLFRSMARAS